MNIDEEAASSQKYSESPSSLPFSQYSHDHVEDEDELPKGDFNTFTYSGQNLDEYQGKLNTPDRKY